MQVLEVDWEPSALRRFLGLTESDTMYNAEYDTINDSILLINTKFHDLNEAIDGDKRITDSDDYQKMLFNHEELNALFTHSVEYTEYDQAHDKYWDKVEQSDAVKEYAESTERHIRHQWHSVDFKMHYKRCMQMLNEDQSNAFDEIIDYRNECLQSYD